MKNRRDEDKLAPKAPLPVRKEDEMGLSSYGAVGTDNLMWGSDYPHAEGTFPRSREILQGILAGRSDEEKQKIAGLNTARLYGFSGEALA